MEKDKWRMYFAKLTSQQAQMCNKAKLMLTILCEWKIQSD